MRTICDTIPRIMLARGRKEDSILDSGITKYMFLYKDWFSTYTEASWEVLMVNDIAIKVHGVGDIPTSTTILDIIF